MTISVQYADLIREARDYYCPDGNGTCDDLVERLVDAIEERECVIREQQSDIEGLRAGLAAAEARTSRATQSDSADPPVGGIA